MIYIFLVFLFLVLELVYFKLAHKYAIIDIPNSRSSHSLVTIRGGGIIFAIALITAYLLGFVSGYVTIAVLIVAIVSFVDDVSPLSQIPRFMAQALAVALIFYDLHLFTSSIGLLLVVLILLIGWINAFNFMDGINGITVLYALSALISFSLLAVNTSSLPVLRTMGLACLVFGFFNIRQKAKTFAGDVGSIAMAVFLGYFMIKTIQETGQIGYLLFFSIYGIDAIVTIFSRLQKRENIFEPHRSHLYQFLANEMEFSHVIVAIGYAVLQMILNVGVIYLDKKGQLSMGVVFMIVLMLTVFYLCFRAVIIRKIRLINDNHV
ncbi:MraY family glycosyltransferase [Flavobacterium restrictum]|uniref:UDP-GlcNAc--UDP-phosphate GlcNAc-1-phosphate transferase n=1 Tax=Flavobacterium restrictum TaxID=2594428 RepID=A0A553E530_9FLAO|nr:UDP-GlcNAc--UDP-phosphate GlcNAc-1-phosphate transferase [Flavobacterium restrictum]TRX40147.1 UDP-GlcNAc--UDP-phosphate GlcNAc-1-phosphate transferase [Flavobacterium restrictum]